MLELGDLLCVFIDLSIVLHSQTLGVCHSALGQTGKCLFLASRICDDLSSRRSGWAIRLGHDDTDGDTFELLTTLFLQDDFEMGWSHDV